MKTSFGRRIRRLRNAAVIIVPLATGCSGSAQTFDPHQPDSPLHLVRTIPLPDVHGRIDHMAIDPATDHLFVAELGNGSVDDVDLGTGAVVGRISGLDEPQGVAWLAVQSEIAVACGDGSVHFYRRADRREVARISLGSDADDVRVDSRNGHLIVGYGSGGLAVIDPSMHRVVMRLGLPAHPEGFEIVGSRVFVNVPDAHQIIIGDLDDGRVLQTLSTGTHFGNYPIAADRSRSYIAVAFRLPSTLSVRDAQSGSEEFSVRVCGDADDLFFRAHRIVTVCGEGAVQLTEETGDHSSVRVATEHGARTGLLDAARNRLFVAGPAGTTPAAVWELSFAEQEAH